MSTSTSTQTSEPRILSANTYFWASSGSASTRRRNEERHQAEVAAYFERLGMTITRSGDYVTGQNCSVRAVFYYRESCKNVYKSLSVTRDGKRSNITALRKLAQS